MSNNLFDDVNKLTATDSKGPDNSHTKPGSIIGGLAPVVEEQKVSQVSQTIMPPTNGKHQVVIDDKYLAEFEGDIKLRHEQYKE